MAANPNFEIVAFCGLDERRLAGLQEKLDLCAFNYYGHNVEDPEGIMEILRQAASGLKS